MCALVVASSLLPSLELWPTRALADSEADDAEVAQYRDRFKQGLDRYEANDVAGALSYWEPIYRDLGPSRGYRIGYNLARAYEVFGDATRAAERYASFLDEVKERRKSGKPLEDVVLNEEAKAAARLDELGKSRGRIHVAATTPPESVRVDQSDPRLAGFVVYVAPGPHDVVFAPSSANEHTERVDVQAGQIVEVAPPRVPVTRARADEPRHVETRDEVHHPFSATWLWVAAGVTVFVGGGLTGAAYANATITFNRFDTGSPSGAQRSQYSNAQTLAYASWAAPASLAIVTGVLAIVYATRTKHVQVPTSALTVLSALAGRVEF